MLITSSDWRRFALPAAVATFFLVNIMQLDENARTSVQLIFTASAFRTGTNVLAPDHAETATDLISHTTESINYQLRLAEQGKL